MGTAVLAYLRLRKIRKRQPPTEEMLQYGGRLRGKGVHGCAFEPAPRCAGGDVFRTVDGLPAVGKITDEDPRDELSVGRTIMKLPLARQYFALPSVGCRPAERFEDPDARSCDVITEAGMTTRLSMLIMPDAGIQLSKWSSVNMPRLAANYKQMFIHLLEGMMIYQHAGYVHGDIHMGNILVDNYNVARYIDFGIAFKPEQVSKWADLNMGRSFNPKHILQAPEIHAWRMYMSGIRVEDGVRRLNDTHPEYAQMTHQYPTHKSLTTAIEEMMGSVYVRNHKVKEFMLEYGTKIDTWRIGLCFWWMWKDLLEWPRLTGTELWGDRDIIRQVLAGLTDFDYATRFSARQALTLLKPSSPILAAIQEIKHDTSSAPAPQTTQDQ